MDDVPLRIILLLILILCNAFFAAAEIALLQINEAKYRKAAEEGDRKARRIVKLISDSAGLLSNIQVGVTLSGFLSSAFAADAFAGYLVKPVLKLLPQVHEGIIRNISLILITLVLSFFTLVFGELVPKRLAMKRADKVARASAGPLSFTRILFLPFIKLLSWTVNLILRILGIDPKEKESDVTEEEILLMVNEGQEQGNIDDDESELINNVFEFDDITCGDIMVHRTEIEALPEDVSFERLLEVASRERYSRLPIYRDSIDNIIGLVHIKSLLGMTAERFDIKKMLIPTIFVADSQKIDDALNILKKNKCHMAVVLDEFGGTAGIVTMEDIIEELVGNIQDEYDDAEELPSSLVVKTGDNEYTVDGKAELDALNDELEIDLPTEDYNTLSGFAVNMLGGIPEVNTHPVFTYKNFRFTVLLSDRKLIKSLKLEIIDTDEKETKNENRDF